MLKVGMMAQVIRPVNFEEGPGWVPETMDQFISQIVTVKQIEKPSKHEPYNKVSIKEGPYFFDINWLRPV